LNLRVVHLLLAALGLFMSRELEEAVSLLALGRWVILKQDSGLEHLVATGLEKLQEGEVVEVLGQVADVHGWFIEL